MLKSRKLRRSAVNVAMYGNFELLLDWNTVVSGISPAPKATKVTFSLAAQWNVSV